MRHGREPEVPAVFHEAGRRSFQKMGGGSVWCNPPYSDITSWVRKAHEEVSSGRCEVVVMLVPARTDTRWFHDWCYNKRGVEIEFVKGRLKFGGAKHNAPFPSMVVVFRRENGHEESA